MLEIKSLSKHFSYYDLIPKTVSKFQNQSIGISDLHDRYLSPCIPIKRFHRQSVLCSRSSGSKRGKPIHDISGDAMKNDPPSRIPSASTPQPLPRRSSWMGPVYEKNSIDPVAQSACTTQPPGKTNKTTSNLSRFNGRSVFAVCERISARSKAGSSVSPLKGATRRFLGPLRHLATGCPFVPSHVARLFLFFLPRPPSRPVSNLGRLSRHPLGFFESNLGIREGHTTYDRVTLLARGRNLCWSLEKGYVAWESFWGFYVTDIWFLWYRGAWR